MRGVLGERRDGLANRGESGDSVVEGIGRESSRQWWTDSIEDVVLPVLITNT